MFHRLLFVVALHAAASLLPFSGFAMAGDSLDQHVLAIKAGRLFDGTGDQYRQNVVIIIEGQRIKSVAPARRRRSPQGAEVIDLSGADRPARPDRLPHAPGQPGRPL